MLYTQEKLEEMRFYKSLEHRIVDYKKDKILFGIIKNRTKYTFVWFIQFPKIKHEASLIERVPPCRNLEETEIDV